MLKQRNEQIQLLIRGTDVLICIISFFVAYWIRSYGFFFLRGDAASLDSISWILAASLTIHFIIYPYFKFYHSLRLKSITQILMMIFQTVIVEFFVLGSLVFFLQAKTTSRYFFGLFLIINYSLLILEKVGARVLLSSIRKRGYNYRQVLICGTGQNAKRIIQALQKNKHWGYLPCGLLHEPQEPTLLGTEIAGVPILGNLHEMEKIIHQQPIDEVIFASDHFDVSRVSKQVSLCERLGIPSRFSLTFFETFFDLTRSKATLTELDHIPVLTFYTTLMTPAEAFLKRCMDITVALLGLIITVILYPWVHWRIRKESPGPVIYKQLRVGENGRIFKCYKFRTMHVSAEQMKNDLLEKNQMEGPIFKIENDPRITSFGAFLRQTSFDELPQFFNILRGDMSVVGTRPPTPEEVKNYETHYRRRLSIRPGLTGLWQVSGRNHVRRFEDILALDLYYIDHWSLWFDTQIIFKTIWVILSKRGAC